MRRTTSEKKVVFGFSAEAEELAVLIFSHKVMVKPAQKGEKGESETLSDGFVGLAETKFSATRTKKKLLTKQICRETHM